MPIPLLVLRHGQTTWNAERRWQGWADAPLSELGRRQAVDAGAHLAGLGFTRVCSSDLSRARDTASLIAGALGMDAPVVVEPALRERDVGSFSGRTIEELLVAYPGSFDPETKRVLSIPDGEDDDALWRRVSPALTALAERHTDDRLLVISHGGVIRTIERHLGLDPGAGTPNLGGRWFTVEEARLVGGESFVPLEAALVTEPPSE